MSKIMNNSENIVREMLEGFVAIHPNQSILANENIIICNKALQNKNNVAVISGGGSGHEPAHAGYVGKGMLHSAVAGDVFTSPSVDAVLTAIRIVAGSKGVLLIVKNYMGDKLNFGLAAEMARAEQIPVEMVIVADDVALRSVADAKYSRGIAGTVLVHKIAGAIADSGVELGIVKKAAQDAANNIATMGVALSSCTLPSLQKPIFDLPPGEIELGLGIHGEKGSKRITQVDANSLVETLLENILQHLNIMSNENVALLVNGLGGATLMELSIITRYALLFLQRKNIKVKRAWSGNYMTALEMHGFSLSLLRLDDSRLKYLDYPTLAPAWVSDGIIPSKISIQEISTPKNNDLSKLSQQVSPVLKKITLSIADALEKAEPMLTELDSACGDGDLGLSMLRGAKAIRELPENAWINEVTLLQGMGEALRKSISGSSGPLYAAGLCRAANFLSQQKKITKESLAEAFLAAVNAISELGGAKLHDRTMLDALYPSAECFKNGINQGLSLSDALHKSIQAAEKGANETTKMLPKLGRASYLGERALGFQDAGAAAVVVWLKALLIL